MKRSKRWTILVSALALTVLCGGAALAANGDQSDPLVTLSYLNQTVIPGVVSQVETKASTRQTELAKNLSDQITQYKQDIANTGGSGSASGVSYTLVTITSGQTMFLDVGCEVMLRVGAATVSAATSPALIDVSTGGTINSGTALTQNHLYMATIADRTLMPTAATVKLLVRGGYSVT
ncbi:MAG: hypothetical protein VB071_07215 [Lawsonibacter sp.]|nr:hypothetical protein [Lawsonibacter sp.]